MKPNQHLKEIALLGSARKALDPTQIPEPIAKRLESKSFPNSEDKILEALSMHHYYSIAGTVPQKYTGVIEQKPIEESLPIIDTELQAIFKQILEIEGQGKDQLLNNWLDTVIQHSQIVASNQIVPILKIAKTSSKKTRAKVIQVIGEKGKWAMSQSEELQIPNIEKSKGTPDVGGKLETDKIWTEGSMAMRRMYFASLRQEEKEKAITLLKNTWNEEGIREKLGFLNIIAETYSETDVPFLEELLVNEFKFKPKEKVTVKTCRSVIVNTLLFMSSTNLHKQTVKQLSNYAGKGKRGLISKVFKKGGVAFNLPDAADDFWNPKNMSETYGFAESNPDISRFQTDALYWFSCFVQAIPFVIWKKILTANGESTIDFFLNHGQFQNVISGKSESNLLPALHALAENHKDQELILYLLKLTNRSGNIELLKLLKPENWEKYLLKNDLLYTGHILSSCPLEEGREWSKSFTDQFLKRITKKLHERKMVLDYHIGFTAATYFNVDSLPLLKKIHQTEANMMQQYNWWAKHFYSKIMETTSIRSQLKNYK